MPEPESPSARSRAALTRLRFTMRMLALLAFSGPSSRGGDAVTYEVDGERPDGGAYQKLRERHGDSDEPHVRARYAIRRGGVLWPAYGTAARHLLRLLVPALAVFLPLGLVAAVAFAVLADGSLTVVNGGIELIGTLDEPLTVWSAVVLVVVAAGQALALPATVVLAAGLITGRPVSAAAALRVARRRWFAVAVVGLVYVLGIVVALVAVLGVLLWSGAQVTAYAVGAVLALAAMPCLPAVAALVLEGRSARGALARSYRLTGGASCATPLRLAFGVLIIPGAVVRGVEWAVSGLPWVPLVTAYVLGLVTVPVQASVIARVFLHRLAWRETSAEFGALMESLPAEPAPALQPLRVLAPLAAPLLLYAATALTNPLGWPEVSETAVEVERAGDGERSTPDLSSDDALVPHLTRDGRLIMMLDGGDQAKLLTCLDLDCTRSRLAYAEPAGALGRFPAAAARLPDGRLVVTTWTEEDVDEAVDDWPGTYWRARLGLLTCDATGCVPAPGGRPITTASRDKNVTVALAPRPGGGLLVAQLHTNPFGGRDIDTLSITTCDDPSCTRPRTRRIARLPARRHAFRYRDLIAGTGPDGRPVILRFDILHGEVVMVTCGDPSCARTHVEEFAAAGSLRHRYRGPERVELAVRSDGRPLVAYEDGVDGAIKLLDCHNRDCSRSGIVTLSDPGAHSAPSMVLDRTGRVLVAYQDADRRRVVLASCTGTRCTRTPVTSIRGGADGLTLTLDARSRPAIIWSDRTDEPGRALLVTTLLTGR